jgi:hypothetical protein
MMMELIVKRAHRLDDDGIDVHLAVQHCRNSLPQQRLLLQRERHRARPKYLPTVPSTTPSSLTAPDGPYSTATFHVSTL